MMDLDRRELFGVMAGLGVLAVAQPARAPVFSSGLLMFNPKVESGERFAQFARVQGATVLAIDTWDYVGFARNALKAAPAFVAGVGFYADQLMIDEVASEHGFRLAASIRHSNGSCVIDWKDARAQCFTDIAVNAGAAWPEVFAAQMLGVADRLKPVGDRGVGESVSWVLHRNSRVNVTV